MIERREDPLPPERPRPGAPARRYRSIWISDLHLGTKGCKAERLVDFLAHVESEHLYLVGDIVDGWQLRRRWHWTDAQTQVVQSILAKARAGTRVVYVPGNHDEALRRYPMLDFSGVRVEREALHRTADGRRLLVLHGDRFDGIVHCHRWLALVGDQAYQLSLWLNDLFNALRRRCGYPYWSLSGYLKGRVKDAVSFVSRFEEAMVAEARRVGVDGVVCGHIHKAELREVDGILYANDGDWVESCTALVEHASGRLEILHWEEPEVAPRAERRPERAQAAWVATP